MERFWEVMNMRRFPGWSGIIDAYKEFLPVSVKTPRVTLLEGNTPLIFAPKLAKEIERRARGKAEGIRVYLKAEGANPTGSFKDRGMTMAVSKAVEEGAQAIICASTGNTSASAAAYGAKAGLRTVVLVPAGKVARGKLAQALFYGAEVLEVEGNFDDAMRLVREVASRIPITIVNSINPYRIEGQKTAAFEICAVLGRSPDYHCIPVGNGGNITAYWKGYKEYYAYARPWRDGSRYHPPRMMGFEASGAAAIVRGHPIQNPETIATAIRIGNPAAWQGAVTARDESGGIIDTVTDTQILDAYEMTARLEGVFCEPSSAAAIAGLIKSAKRGSIKSNSLVVCTLTGHGLKDPDTAMSRTRDPRKIKPDIDELLRVTA